MPSFSLEHLDLYSAPHVPDSHTWPSSYLHDHPATADNGGSKCDISEAAAPLLVGTACRSFGVFYATGHGIPIDILDEVEYQARRLFALPLHQKLVKARRPGIISGYGRPPLSAFFPKLMWSEGFTIAGSHRGDIAGDEWMQEHSIFCDVMEKYNKKMKEVAGKLLGLMLLSLGIDEEQTGRAGLTKDLAKAMEVLQLNSYPACPEPDKTIGMAAHTDSGLLTVLHQSGGTNGLQILRRADGFGPTRWVTLPPLKGALVVHVGDLLQILSNDQFKSVRHRAVVSRTEHRLSAAYIVGPPDHMKIEPINKLVESGQNPIYRSVTWPEYLGIRAQMFDKALELVKLNAK
ncbi:gibberellin 3-beta-dioxygenase 1-like [Phalaenopsis equestris]|uniref:gibberellin 3-beta-dioxygenase 1-like n=1 Tax=Phalaenopsis equestris TaxID=78828 RepID=UPI0009E3BEF3|nr:gibberellin 3-beta-dioxygenase 1-like [Phalaenopsis equestris]